MTKTYETRVLKVTVLPKDDPIFANHATEIEIVDEAAGEYLEVSQCNDENEGKIQIDPYEWPYLKEAIEQMIKECRKERLEEK